MTSFFTTINSPVQPPFVRTLAQAPVPNAPGAIAPAGMPGANGTSTATQLPAGGTTGAAGATATGGGSGASSPMGGMGMLPFLLMMGALLAFMFWQSRKEKKRRETLMNSIKRGDKVMLNSGMIGYVVELTNDEVVIRMEEGKARFSRSAIQTVISAPKPGNIAETKESGKAVGAA